jgi:hypothetical protein
MKNVLTTLIEKAQAPTQKDLTDITNMNAYSSSFDFLADEPEVYSIEDVRDKNPVV